MDGGTEARRGARTVTAWEIAGYCCLVALGGWLFLGMLGVQSWHAAALMTAAAGVAIAAVCALYCRGMCRGDDGRMECLWRCRLLSGRISTLIDTIPCRTEAETLAAFHEIRTCYTEMLALAAKLGDWGEPMTATMRENLAQIDKLYGIQSGSLRRTEANAADFAAAMRALGRDVDGSETCEGR